MLGKYIIDANMVKERPITRNIQPDKADIELRQTDGVYAKAPIDEKPTTETGMVTYKGALARVEKAEQDLEQAQKLKTALLKELASLQSEQDPEDTSSAPTPQADGPSFLYPKTEKSEDKAVGFTARVFKQIVEVRSSAEIQEDLSKALEKYERIKGRILKIPGLNAAQIRILEIKIGDLQRDLQIARGREKLNASVARSVQSREDIVRQAALAEQQRVQAAREALLQDIEKYPFKYFLLNKISLVNLQVIFKKWKEDVTLEEINWLMGPNGEEVSVNHLEEVEERRFNAISVTSNGFYLKLINRETVKKINRDRASEATIIIDEPDERHGEIVKSKPQQFEEINRQDPRARYEIYRPDGTLVPPGKYELDFKRGQRELKSYAEDYQREQWELFQKEQRGE